MSKFGIKRTPIESRDNQYKRSKEEVLSDLEENISFSFKYLNFNSKFTISECELDYFDRLLQRLKILGTMKMEEFLDKKHIDVLRNHKIDWEKDGVTETGFNLPLEADILDEPWQFSVSSGRKNGRVHGFIIGNIFYIVWFDPKHNLDIGKGGKWSVDIVRQNPRAKALEENFTPLMEKVYLHDTEVMKQMMSIYEQECDNCDIKLEKLWYNCVFCNESNNKLLLNFNGTNICYNCLDNINKIDEEESA